MNDTKYALLITIFKIMVKHNKYWCYASQKTMIRLLKEHHGTKINRRQINYHLADMRTLGYIRTIKRNYKKIDGTIHAISSATCITIKGYKYLTKMAIREAWARIKELKRRYIPEPEKETAQENTTLAREVPPPATKKNPFKDPLWRKAHGLKPDFCLP